MDSQTHGNKVEDLTLPDVLDSYKKSQVKVTAIKFGSSARFAEKSKSAIIDEREFLAPKDYSKSTRFEKVTTAQFPAAKRFLENSSASETEMS